MSVKITSRMSLRRILISLMIYALLPLIAYGLNLFTDNSTIAYTFALNLIGWVLIIYDWNLFGIHYNRVKDNPGDGFLYILVGVLLIGLWDYFNHIFLGGQVLIPDGETVREYAFAAPAILFAFSFMWSAIVSISFKCFTDHFDIRDKELLIILASGFLFGALQTVLFTYPLTDIPLLVSSYLYNVVLISILSYLYNQSGSFLPGLAANALVQLLFFFLFAF